MTLEEKINRYKERKAKKHAQEYESLGDSVVEAAEFDYLAGFDAGRKVGSTEGYMNASSEPVVSAIKEQLEKLLAEENNGN